MELWVHFEKIPATFWGVLIGAFFSFGGVALTNRATDRRQEKQLNHDRQVKDRDREMSLKRDVYLAAMEAIYAGFISVSRFANLDVPTEEVTEAYLEKSPAIAKVHVVARGATAQAVVAFTTELAAIQFRLFAKRIPLTIHKRQLDSVTEQLASSTQERDAILGLMKQHYLEGSIDQRKLDILDRDFQLEQQRLKELAQRHDELTTSFSSARLVYAQDCIADIAQLTRLMASTVIAIRHELDLAIDEVAYRKILEDGLRKQEADVREFFSNISVVQSANGGDTQEEAAP